MSHNYWKESKLHPLRATGRILVRYVECTETDVHNAPGSTLFYILALNFLYLNLMFFLTWHSECVFQLNQRKMGVKVIFQSWNSTNLPQMARLCAVQLDIWATFTSLFRTFVSISIQLSQHFYFASNLFPKLPEAWNAPHWSEHERTKFALKSDCHRSKT